MDKHPNADKPNTGKRHGMGILLVFPLLSLILMARIADLSIPMAISASFSLMFVGKPIQSSTEAIAGGETKARYVTITGYELPQRFFVEFDYTARHSRVATGKRTYRFFVSDTSKAGKEFRGRLELAEKLMKEVEAVPDDEPLPASLERKIYELEKTPPEVWDSAIAVTERPIRYKARYPDEHRSGWVATYDVDRPSITDSEFSDIDPNAPGIPPGLTDEQMNEIFKQQLKRKQIKVDRKVALYILNSLITLNRRTTLTGCIMKIPFRERRMMKGLSLYGSALHVDVGPTPLFKSIFIATAMMALSVVSFIALIVEYSRELASAGEAEGEKQVFGNK